MSSPVPFERRKPLPPDIAKRLPQNIEAERCILGAIILDNDALARAAQHVEIGDFMLPQHTRIFSAMLGLRSDNHPIDTITLMERLQTNGNLEAAGGVPYLSQLSDGLPRVTNVEHYALIVKEKSRLRSLAYSFWLLHEQAEEGNDSSDELAARAEKSLGELQKAKTGNPSVVVGFRSLLTMTLPALEYAIEPLLSTGGTGEIYGWRGSGKSLIATEIAVQIASGAPVLFPHPRAGGNWPVSRRHRVLYVYGEMHQQTIQLRAQQIARGHGLASTPEDEWLGVMCKDFQKVWRPNVATARNRKIIEERIAAGGYELLILDNISTLWPASQEGESDRSAILTDWFMDLNQRGVSVIYLHHAGKSGQQRGSSEKEDMVDFVLRLKRPENHRHDPNLCAEILIEKLRGECKQPRWMSPFEIYLQTVDDTATWTIRPARDAQIESAFAMFNDGMKPSDVFPELGIGRSTAFKYKKLYDQNSDPKRWLTEQE